MTIPVTIDAALVREHAYENSKLLKLVLNPEVRVPKGGYKSIKEYGLGYFNYVLGMQYQVTDVSVREQIRDHFYRHFNMYFSVWMVAFVVWVLYVSQQSPASLISNGFRRGKRKGDELEMVYQHMKV
ncbi:AFR676Cp [Eremothecium gossypii ATCC 10895]|uniref:AFR676Cp n=1 Tax=Eremothecium gossypii (strain ATCC 10895 / CBS 109.51 / FGSC 9923 / NRRL Y-1056) TaxID=284811 RepID=Q751Z9_EREGS|nr:AFR676Cp [Eremothecium gossypii ATCC 10895]AAS54048.2 AFR676Cp [Eremothecium gossypii ATCC 10895]AEY98363.1 FAFR676Cp [Eremothecium gossypii FDAG1]